MHPNTQLLDKLFRGLNNHDHRAMAKCYHPEATFHDIAFDLKGRRRIHAMWHMISTGDIRATFEVIEAGDSEATVKVLDEYTFTDTRRAVRNPIESRFTFKDGLIIEQRDQCDAKAWAAMALGGLAGFLAGRIHLLRSRKANQKLAAFIGKHPEYAGS